jgi:hypothetical protein
MASVVLNGDLVRVGTFSISAYMTRPKPSSSVPT